YQPYTITFQTFFPALYSKTSLLLLIQKEPYMLSGTFQAFFQLVCQNFLALTHTEGALYVAGTFQAFFQLVCQNI
ncbi:hypothetical protein, partial [Paraclostridium bifermentans]|uniref:hypothetical protein n=1 Tax=Paraclostridium bifermentans TaxID=1490 RepID=UPI0021C2DAB9